MNTFVLPPRSLPSEQLFWLPDDLKSDPFAPKVYAEGIAGAPGILEPQWATQAGQDVMAYLPFALANGAVTGRGPNRGYLCVPPGRLTYIWDILRRLLPYAAGMLGPDVQVNEIAADFPLVDPLGGPQAYATRQPVHRDGPLKPPADGRMDSVVFNATCTTVTPEHGPFRYFPWTHHMLLDGSLFRDMFLRWDLEPHWDDSDLYRHSYPKPGDGSWRNYTMMHCGTDATRTRIVLVISFCQPHVGTSEHQLIVTPREMELIESDPALRGRVRVTAVEDTVPYYKELRTNLEELMSTPALLTKLQREASAG